MKGAAVAYAVLAALLLTGCNHLDGCAGLGSPDIRITVVDSLTGLPAAAGATFLSYDVEQGGAPVDSITGQVDAQVLQGMTDRTGRFTVTVRKAGYRDWTKSNVLVLNGCPTIQTVTLTARLVRP